MKQEEKDGEQQEGAGDAECEFQIGVHRREPARLHCIQETVTPGALMAANTPSAQAA